MKRYRNPNKPFRYVDAVNNHDDHVCVLLALRGRSNRAIARETGLSWAQIGYRLKKYEIKRMDYRDGIGAFAKQVDKATEVLAEKALMNHLRRHVGKG